MTFEEAQKIVRDGGEVTDAVKAALSGYDPQAALRDQVEAAVKAQTDSIAAAARKDAEAKLKAEGDRAAQLQAQLDEINAKTGTEEEQHEKRLQALQAQIETLNSDLKGERERANASARNAEIRRIRAGLNFNKDTVTDDYAEYLVNTAFADLSTEDLANEGVVKPILDTLQTGNPQLFAAAVPSGAGSNGGAGGAGGVQTVSTESLTQMALNANTPEEIAKAQEQLQAAAVGARDGSVKLE